jgi:hypothetical protein
MFKLPHIFLAEQHERDSETDTENGHKNLSSTVLTYDIMRGGPPPAPYAYGTGGSEHSLWGNHEVGDFSTEEHRRDECISESEQYNTVSEIVLAEPTRTLLVEGESSPDIIFFRDSDDFSGTISFKTDVISDNECIITLANTVTNQRRCRLRSIDQLIFPIYLCICVRGEADKKGV